MVQDLLSVLVDFDEYEIIIVDDGSTDGTAEIADRLSAEHPGVRAIHHPKNRGLAAVYRTGLRAATKDYYTWVGGDREIDVASIRAILNAIGEADLVIPYHGTPQTREWHRRVITWTATQQLNWLFGWNLHYYQGPTVYPRELAMGIPVKNEGFFFASEMLIRALSSGLTWVEVGLAHQQKPHSRSRAVTVKNLVSAELTVLVLWWWLRVSIGRPVLRQV
jgi:glycosyltransferase involved in cell wall biosynthesis